MLLEVDAAQRVVAARAGLAEVPVHAVDVGVALPGEPEVERAPEIDVDRRGEALDLVGCEVGRDAKRGELRFPENLVRVCPADTRDRALVAEERVQLSPLTAEDLAETRGVELERLGAEMCELRLEPAGVRSHTPARFFLPPSVRTSSPPSAKRSENIGFAGPFLPGARYRRRPALIRCTRRTSSPSAVGKSRFFARRSAPANDRSASAVSGGSNVFSVAMCPDRALSIGERETSGSSSRTQASTSGSSGMP